MFMIMLSLSHIHTRSLSLSRSLSHTHTLCLDFDFSYAKSISHCISRSLSIYHLSQTVFPSTLCICLFTFKGEPKRNLLYCFGTNQSRFKFVSIPQSKTSGQIVLPVLVSKCTRLYKHIYLLLRREK